MPRGKGLKGFYDRDDHYLLSLDGTSYFPSQKVHGAPCVEQHQRNGTMTYYHPMLVAGRGIQISRGSMLSRPSQSSNPMARRSTTPTSSDRPCSTCALRGTASQPSHCRQEAKGALCPQQLSTAKAVCLGCAFSERELPQKAGCTKSRLRWTGSDILEHAPGMETTQESILDLARTRGLLRPLDLAGHGLPRVSLTRLVRQGWLTRVGHGLYALPVRGFKGLCPNR